MHGIMDQLECPFMGLMGSMDDSYRGFRSSVGGGGAERQRDDRQTKKCQVDREFEFERKESAGNRWLERDRAGYCQGARR